MWISLYLLYICKLLSKMNYWTTLPIKPISNTSQYVIFIVLPLWNKENIILLTELIQTKKRICTVALLIIVLKSLYAIIRRKRVYVQSPLQRYDIGHGMKPFKDVPYWAIIRKPVWKGEVSLSKTSEI